VIDIIKMQPLRMSMRFISGTRILPQPLSSKPAVCFCQHPRREFGRSTRLYERAAALPEKTRELASRDAPASAAEQTIESESNILLKGRLESSISLIDHGPKFGSGNLVTIGDSQAAWHPAYLRDSCSCPQCRDPSSTQKTFQTTDIPANIEAKSIEVLENRTVKITWKNDIPGFGLNHTSTFSQAFFSSHITQKLLVDSHSPPPDPRVWHKNKIAKELESINYEDYMKDDEVLHRALLFMNLHGLLLLKGVPESETAVEDIVGRVGTIRDTFYGRTWDVKSVPEAKNVAYTHQHLGLHMDLLYMANPPGFQLLHCLKNTCEGGSSLFSDSFQAAFNLRKSDFDRLSDSCLAYQYKNAGEHYYHTHNVIEKASYFVDTHFGLRTSIRHVNYSPPFQADHLTTLNYQTYPFPQMLRSLVRFAALVESPENLYEYKMEEGDCVIFNNRRVLHGRREFDAKEGERWLKGAYVDTDVFMSRWRVLNEKYKKQGDEIIEALEENEFLGPLASRLKKSFRPMNYVSPFKKKAEKLDPPL